MKNYTNLFKIVQELDVAQHDQLCIALQDHAKRQLFYIVILIKFMIFKNQSYDKFFFIKE